MIFSDGKVSLSYNFWSEHGIVQFGIYNETNEYITIHLDQSFFIKNDNIYDYYHNSSYNSSSSQTYSYGNSLGGWGTYTPFYYNKSWNMLGYQKSIFYTSSINKSITSTQSKTIIENPRIIIPPKSARIIREYSINAVYYALCELSKYVNYDKNLNANPNEPKNLSEMIKNKPVSDDVSTKTISPQNFISFTKENSPFRFRNIITYTIEQESKINRIDYAFYVAHIQNFIDRNFLRTEYEENCGKKDLYKTYKYSPFASENKFYISYQ